MTITDHPTRPVLDEDDARLIATIATLLGQTTGWSRPDALAITTTLGEIIALAENGPGILPAEPTPVTTLAELNRLPQDTVVRLVSGFVADRRPDGLWWIAGFSQPGPVLQTDLPAVVLHQPALAEEMPL